MNMIDDEVPLASPYGLKIDLARTALFIDLDGTLVEQAGIGQPVQLSRRARSVIDRLGEATAGSLALVSSRTLENLKSLDLPASVNIAGLYGLELRSHDGTTVMRMPENFSRVAAAAAELTDFARHYYPELLLETKGVAVSVRCLGPTALTRMMLTRMQAAVRGLGPAYHLVQRNNIFEIKPRKANKGNAIRDYMVDAPFHGRVPVYIGDDVSDEEGFQVINDLAGLSVRVGRIRRGMTRARFAVPSVSALVDWLEFVLRRHDIDADAAVRF